ncbi:MAG: hypothetical protein Q9218_006292 [Villophora microphyllina]
MQLPKFYTLLKYGPRTVKGQRMFIYDFLTLNGALACPIVYNWELRRQDRKRCQELDIIRHNLTLKLRELEERDRNSKAKLRALVDERKRLRQACDEKSGWFWVRATIRHTNALLSSDRDTNSHMGELFDAVTTWLALAFESILELTKAITKVAIISYHPIQRKRFPP